MTDRKPLGMSVESWVERQILAAQERGELDDLPGSGKPLPQRPAGELDWIAQKVRSENLDTTPLLPPALALAKELDELPRTLAGERAERRVREIVTDLNERIRYAQRNPQVGPPLRAVPVDPEETVRAWRQARSEA
ncbi:molecular chaperone DnaJ [Amycolatopsis antarctica]|uniref:Molecular chaperone DnaJ n=1 Tax=Amycolatopsis antarctica TaxID=1854586 RepID=A0A263D177_9PSEU|nr:DUF1992 domain-containing protein [Amycolatopsis antarctica]OZM71959.1 molecular chaperone DnaJ [Amycolatopsis antarctica]